MNIISLVVHICELALVAIILWHVVSAQWPMGAPQLRRAGRSYAPSAGAGIVPNCWATARASSGGAIWLAISGL